MKVVIVGGVAGGASAAARLRRLDETAEIVVLERSSYISYANCGIPYFIGGTIQERKAMTLQTPHDFFARFKIDVRVRNEVISIDRQNKLVTVVNLDTGIEYQESYDNLILSPGAKPKTLNLPGSDHPQVFTIRNLEDTFALKSFMDKNQPQKAVVVGGGFIGLEMAENLMHRGIAVTLVQFTSQVLPFLDFEMACLVHKYLRHKGLDLRLERALTSFHTANGNLSIGLDDGTQLETDLVIMAIGIEPESKLAKLAGLQLGESGAIRVNPHMQTSDPSIYAVGDAVEVVHRATGLLENVALAGPANRQGRVAADNICGLSSKYTGAQGTSIIKLFNLTAAGTGLNTELATKAGIPCETVIIDSKDHAGYYPGSKNMMLKLLFAPDTGTVLGAQIVGYAGVDKRCDVLATAIRAKLTVHDLTELELAYAPPYSLAKDPVNMLGYVAENLLLGKVKQFYWQDLNAIVKDPNAVLLDTRDPHEFAQGHIAGALHIPLNHLRDLVPSLDKSLIYYIYCRSGHRSYLACRLLTQLGFTCQNLSGGYLIYEPLANTH
jgi:NADPH-dependent 2,4-dienoyl-CoA reductase/sulfur reductase-like enzyme/rhodanese-related sulfurtransferase